MGIGLYGAANKSLNRGQGGAPKGCVVINLCSERCSYRRGNHLSESNFHAEQKRCILIEVKSKSLSLWGSACLKLSDCPNVNLSKVLWRSIVVSLHCLLIHAFI